jgi:hypothetical protein
VDVEERVAGVVRRVGRVPDERLELATRRQDDLTQAEEALEADGGPCADAVPSTITISSPLSAMLTGVRSPGVMVPSSVPVQSAMLML